MQPYQNNTAGNEQIKNNGGTKSSHNYKNISLFGIAPKTIQPKLSVNTPGDKYEQEADAMADKVIQTTGNNSIQRKCSDCEEEEKIQRKPLSTNITPLVQTRQATNTPAVTPSLNNHIETSRGCGKAMDSHTRSFMSNGFGVDFSHVKIHADHEAASMNKELNAKAFTVGNDIYFNEGEYQPGSSKGKHLLAHELTHVIQQRSMDKRVQRTPCITDPAICANNDGNPGVFDDNEHSGLIIGDAIMDEDNGTTGGQSRRAVNLETIARQHGLYPRAWVHGFFVNQMLSQDIGAETMRCSNYEWETANAQPQNPNVWCVFFHESEEHNAGIFLHHPSEQTIDEIPRNEWLLNTMKKITHEFEHVRFYTSVQSSLNHGSCNRNTLLDARHDVNYFLSELGAQLSEFIYDYNIVNPTRSTSNMSRREMMAEAARLYRWHLSQGGENILGILRALRCHCPCDEVNDFVMDTFNFTTRTWDAYARDFFLEMLSTQYPEIWQP